MCNRTRKVISILCVLALLCALLPGAALAKNGKSRAKSAKSITPQISVGGSAMYLSFDGGVTSSVWLSAGSSGTVELTLILSEDCGLSVSLNGGDVGLTVKEDLVRTCRYNVVAGESYLLEITPNRSVTIGVRADKWRDPLETDPEDAAGEESDPDLEIPEGKDQEDPSGVIPSEDDADGQTGETPEENDHDAQSGDNSEDASGETVGEELPQETSEEDADSSSAETGSTDAPQADDAEMDEEVSQAATDDLPEQLDANEELPEQEEPQDSSEESPESLTNQEPEGTTDQGFEEEQTTEGQGTESAAPEEDQTEVQSETENPPESGEGALILAEENEEVPTEIQEPSEPALINTIAETLNQEDSEEDEEHLAVQTEGTGGKLNPEEETELPVPEQNEPSAQQEPASPQENCMPSQTEPAEPQPNVESQIPAAPQTETEPEPPTAPQAEAEPQTPVELQAETQPQSPTEPQTETEPQNPVPAAEEILPMDRSATFEVTFDTDSPAFGDTAHFKALLKGYDEVEYSLQWQYSLDDENWEDIPEATGPEMDITVTRENHLYFWRIMVYVHLPESET